MREQIPKVPLAYRPMSTSPSPEEELAQYDEAADLSLNSEGAPTITASPSLKTKTFTKANGEQPDTD